MAITVKHNKVSTIPDGDDTSVVRPSDWNADHTLTGLGTMAEQNANSVAITGGTVSGTTLTSDIVSNNLAFTPTSAPTYVEGDLWYDSTQKALTYYNDVTNNQVHIGQEVQLKVINNTGSSIANGTPVYVTGTSSGQTYPNIALAQANATRTSAVLGLTNGTIASGAVGYVCTAGLLTPCNTGSFSVGQVLYLSPYSAGQLMNTVPPTGYAVQVGVVAYANSPNGSIYVKQTTPLAVSASTIVGQVAVANGGTGASTLTGYVKGSGTSAMTASATIPTTDLSGTVSNAQLANSTITINGNSTALGGSVSVGTVTSVAATAGTGISVTGSPITSSGTLNITNTAPDQTVVLTAGTGISTSGTYPNFTITNTAPSSGGTVTSVSGTAPVSVATGTTTPVISLATGYGDTQNPYASKTANYILAAPNGSAGAPTFRAMVAADVPTLNQNTTGSAAKWTTARTESLTGDITGSTTVDGSANYSIATTLATVNSNVGTFTKITANGKGLVTAASQASLTDLSSPTASFSFGSQNLTNLLDPVNAQDAATKLYVDNTAQGLDAKASCVAATTVSITLVGGQVIDGVTVVAGDRVLVKNQSSAAANGIYVVQTTSWTRSTDMDTWAEVPNAYVWIEGGTTQADTGWVCTSNAGGTLGTTAINWVQFAGAGSYTAGTGLTLTGTQFAIDSTVATLTGSQTLTNKTISGTNNTLSNIGNSSLTNSAITINGTSTSLGGSVSVGTVTSVTGTAPVVSSGGNTPAISMAKATSIVDGYLSAIDWNTFNNKQPAGSYLTAVTASAPLSGSGTAGSPLVISQATTSTNGYLTSTDWNTFNNKGSGTVTSVSALTLGTTGTDLSSTVATGTTTPVITLNVPTASASNRGALSSTDWSTFNGKQATLVSGTNIKTINTNSILGSGDLTISATPAGSTTQVQFNNAGAFSGSSSFTWSGTALTAPQYIGNQSITGSSTQGAFAYGTLGYSDVNHILTMASSQNSYIQMEIQNTNAGASASSDVVVGNNNTTSTAYYGDFGMNSGGWSGTGAFNSPNTVYLTATTGDLALGTTTSNQIRFAVNGGTTDALTISTAGAVTTPNQLTGATVRASNAIHVNSKTVSASYTIASGDSAMSVGPITVATGQAVTISSGSRWVVL
jgi:hypothetical protein